MEAVLHLLPAAQVLFYQQLAGGGQGPCRYLTQLMLVVGHPAPPPAQGKGGPRHDRVPDVVRCLQCGLHCDHRDAGRHGHADLSQPLAEQLTVLGILDALDGRSQYLNPVLAQDACPLQCDAAVQGRLAPEGQEDGIGLLPGHHPGNEGGGNGKEVHPVRHPFGGLDGGDVRVDEHRGDALLLEGLEGLGARVVELAGLANAQRSRAQDQHLPRVMAARHVKTSPLPARRSGRTGGPCRWVPVSPRGGTAPPMRGRPRDGCPRSCRRWHL